MTFESFTQVLSRERLLSRKRVEKNKKNWKSNTKNTKINKQQGRKYK